MTENKKEKVPLRSLVKCIIEQVKCEECPYLRVCKDKARKKLKENQELVIV
jgi:hypothetical protein